MIIRINIDPVPASRPRIGLVGRKCPRCHRGTTPVAFYAKPYQRFKTALVKAIKAELPKKHKPLDGQLIARVIVTVKRPKTTKLDDPAPDVDNYMKGVFDACNGTVWTDDKKVKRCVLEKQWGKAGSIVMEVVPYVRKAKG